MMSFPQWPGGEMETSSYFNQNWNSQPSSNNGWQYAGTTLTGMHGHMFTNATISSETLTASSMSITGVNQPSGSIYGCLNSQSTGIWVNKTKRDNLCIQRANNASDYSSYISTTQISTVGYGAFFTPISSTRDFSGYGNGPTNGYNTTRSYGCVGYNETTKMWVIAANAANGAGATINVYKNINPPTLANTNDQTFWNQFNHSSKITITFTTPSVTATHDYQHYKLIPLDNGDIALVWKQEGTSIRYFMFVGNAGVNSTSWTFSGTALLTINTTTSYHDSDWVNHDFMPAMMSPDGKYVFVWTQYYYYQTGICGMAIRVSDGAVRYINFADSSDSYAPVFLRKNTLCLGYSVNADSGRGQSLYHYDLDNMFVRVATNYGNITNYKVEANIESQYTSTCYPMIWQQTNYLPNFIRGVF